jgi:LemA protein
MKKLIPIIILVLIGVTAYRRVVGNYNQLVTLDESVQTSRSQVENQYQRRADLIPNLVNTVRGAADQELRVLEQVTQARASATQTTVDIDDVESMAQYQAAQGELSSALGRLLVSVEAYPQLQANQNFLELQAQLEGTENRITTERMRYNEMVRTFNTRIRTFPTTLIASIFGFERAVLFEAQAGAETAPEVEFFENDTDTDADVLPVEGSM